MLILSHTSAFLYWRAFTGNRRRLPRPADATAMAQAERLTPTVRGELAAFGFVPTPKRPVDLLFSDERARSQTRGIRAHVTGENLPEGAIYRVSEHVAVVCPELCFLQMAKRFSPEQLILAGFEMCGTYAQVGPELALQEREALTSAAAIRAFAATLPHTSTASALRALDYVLDGAASPMEAKTAMLLTLPTSRGGYGLPAPQLNPELPTTPEARQLYRRGKVRPDLYWPDARFDLEYDGGNHEDADTHAGDVARLGALAVMGVDVLTLSAPQLYDAAAFHRLAGVVASRLGRRLRVRRADFPVRVTRLREELGL